MNYGGLPKEFSGFAASEIVIVPVPYDGTSTWIKGADKGPAALLEASANMELYDIETDSEVYRKGIYTSKEIRENSNPENMTEAVYIKTLNYLNENKFVVTLGGEHSVSIGAIKAHSEKFRDLTVLQIDAHTDLRPQYEGSKYNHGGVMSRVKEMCPAVQVGIRSMDVEERQYLDPDFVFFARSLQGDDLWMDKAIGKLSANVYLTFDLDGLDPSIMPSTGTPEPGGLLWYPTIKFLKKVIEKRNLVGFDVVELCPDEKNKSSDFLAAKLVYKILSYKFLNSR
ncbi:MAG: agmatinase [Bacteroidetes bacterium]|nr:agmatinase [Bacteroidota bacterium]